MSCTCKGFSCLLTRYARHDDSLLSQQSLLPGTQQPACVASHTLNTPHSQRRRRRSDAKYFTVACVWRWSLRVGCSDFNKYGPVFSFLNVCTKVNLAVDQKLHKSSGKFLCWRCTLSALRSDAQFSGCLLLAAALSESGPLLFFQYNSPQPPKLPCLFFCNQQFCYLKYINITHQ